MSAMQLDLWREEEEALPSALLVSSDTWDIVPVEATTIDDHRGLSVALRERSTALRAAAAPEAALDGQELSVQARAAASTSSFVFAHRQLSGVEAYSLPQYLRDDCHAKFVDLSSIAGWSQASLALANAVRLGLRATRSLVLDGNNLTGQPEAFDAWCCAIRDHPGLQQLSLRDTKLDDNSTIQLAEVLREHSVLFAVDLSNNRIGDAGVEALVGALQENRVLLEIGGPPRIVASPFTGIEGTDASEAAWEALAAALEQNSSRLGRGSGMQVLRRLRRAKAEAVTACSQLALAADSTQPVSPVGSSRQAALPPLCASIPYEPRPAAAVEEADGVFFEASGEGVCEELSRRSDAGWRYTAADREVLMELRRTIAELQQIRRLEKQRGDEILERVVQAQQQFRERLAPKEDRILELKAELADEVEVAKRLLQGNIQQKLELRACQEELEKVRIERQHSHVTAQKADHGLKLRHQEVAEGIQRLQREIEVSEQTATALAAENEKFRRRLHAARFETDRERFVPASAVVATAAVVEGLKGAA